MTASWQPAPETPATWLHRLPRAVVVQDRAQWLVSFVGGRRTVHIGFGDVGCEVTNRSTGRWLHDRLAASASELVGLDVSPDAVEIARREGFTAHAVDCTNAEAVAALDLGQFDVAVLGEIIEHVDNPGGLLEAAKILVGSDGEVVVTTPNARRLMDVLLAAFGREVIHPDHVAVYSVRTLVALLDRHEWSVTRTLTYLSKPTRRPRTVKEMGLRTATLVQRALARTVSPYVADGLIVTARKRASQ